MTSGVGSMNEWGDLTDKMLLKSLSTSEIQELIIDTSRKAIYEDGAEVICLGGAVMSGLEKPLEEALGVPVLDGVVCALKMVEGLVGYGVQTSKKRLYSFPQTKELDNLEDQFLEGYQGSY
jgi:Asp/Glu/hydantoin racemase